MKRIFAISVLPVLGVWLMLAGFVYDMQFAGIPYQDPTPQMEINYYLHQKIGGTISQLGARILLLGILVGMWLLRDLVKPSQRTSGP